MQVISSMSIGKSPGCDGLTTEFYKLMWPQVGQTLIDSFNYFFEHGELLNLKNGVLLHSCKKKGERSQTSFKTFDQYHSQIQTIKS